jgi:hypothetical protein
MVAIAKVICRCLVAMGIRVEMVAHFENWSRPPGCECDGCRNWHRVECGERTVEELGQAKLICSNRSLAWKEEALIGEQWNYGTMAMWLLGIALLYYHPLLSLPVFAITTGQGRTDMLVKYLNGTSYTAAFYFGLVDGTSAPTFAGTDTMASHSGWIENTTSYSNATRVQWVGASVGTAIVDNSASPAVFNAIATATIAGTFMTTSNTKGGTGGTLFGEAAFNQGNRTINNGDTLTTITSIQAS